MHVMLVSLRNLVVGLLHFTRRTPVFQNEARRFNSRLAFYTVTIPRCYLRYDSLCWVLYDTALVAPPVLITLAGKPDLIISA